MNEDISILIGKTLSRITVCSGLDVVTFETDNGEKYKLFHRQDCCESVSIEDISGDVDDLIGSPITMAHETSNSDKPRNVGSNYEDESFTWTFYILATVKGYVTLRWYGSSNGYYSERVDFERIE